MLSCAHPKATELMRPARTASLLLPYLGQGSMSLRAAALALLVAALIAKAASPLGAAGAWAGQLDSIEVAEVWSADGHRRLEMLSSIDGMAELPSGEIWISAGWEGVYAVDPSQSSGAGDSWIAAANDGEGPGELSSPKGILLTDRGIVAVHDAGQDQVEFFLATGEHFRRVQLRLGIGWQKGFAILPSGEFLASGGAGLLDGAVHRFSQAGEYLDSWEASAPAEGMYARYVGTGGSLHAAPDGSVLYSQNAPHRIVRYRFPEEPGAEVSIQVIAEIPDLLAAPDDDLLVRETDGGLPQINHDYSRSIAVYAIKDGRVLNIIKDFDDDESSTIWQLFAPRDGDLEYELIAQSRIANYTPYFLCDDGDILASRTDALGVDSAVRLRWSVR